MINIDELISKSMKEQNHYKLNALRNFKNEILKYKTAKNAKPYTDNAEISILKKMISQYKDSIEQFNAAGRIDLAENEENELKEIQKFMPEPISEEELNTIFLEACEHNDIDTNVNYLEFIPKNKMGIIINYIKDKCPQNDPVQIVELVKLHLIK